MKSVEQRLYEAWRSGNGIRLSIEEIDVLMGRDDAVRTRIANRACVEAGVEECGFDFMGSHRQAPTWSSLVDSLRPG